MNQPNIILIVWDAVRADHVSWYGYERETTPTFDDLAKQGIVYRNAFSPSVWTPTVHGSIFTGKYPSHSGVYTGSLALPEDESVLPELLSKAGYRTFATSSGAHIRRDRGYARGFDEFIETYRIRPDKHLFRKFFTDSSYRRQVGFSLSRGPDDKTLYKFERMRKFIEQDDERPYFCFVNCKTAHRPWNPPRPYKRMWCPELSRPRVELLEQMLMVARREPLSIQGYDINRIRQLQDGHPVLAGEMNPSEGEWDVIKSWYDGAIRYLDYRLSLFVDHLKTIDEFNNTLLVITSDHGDHFGDHGLAGHLFSVHDTLVHVPLVISPPRGSFDPGTVIDSQVTLVDLYNTFLEAAGVKREKYPLTTSLLPWKERTYHDFTFTEYAFPSRSLNTVSRNHPDFEAEKSGFARSLRAIRGSEFKLILGSDGKKWLYRWRDDPRETINLAGDRPDMVERLQNVIDERLGSLEIRGEEKEELSEEVREQLVRMGYL